MKKRLFLLLVIASGLSTYSQINFEKGYYINNDNQKIDCLIKNLDWLNNPIQFEYKSNEGSESRTLSIESVKEFGIYDISKYLRAIVEIDRSSEEIKKMSRIRDPEFREEQLFLKVLVEGKGTLFSYVDGNLRKYFYRLDNSEIQQLIFKSFKLTNVKIVKNYRFRQQLWENLNCPNISKKEIEALNYKRKELENFFIGYNTCNSSESTSPTKEVRRDFFNLTIRPGLQNSSLAIRNNLSSTRDVDFGTNLALRLGLESEFIMPFNKNKWSTIIEPTYQSFKADKALSTEEVSIDYSSIELPIGLRHYFFLNETSRIFANCSVVFDFVLDSKINFSDSPDLNINSNNNFALGFGYKHGDVFSLEFRYCTSVMLIIN